MNDLALSPADQPLTGTAATIMTPGALNALVEFSKLMAASAVTVPDHLRGKPADCLAVAMQAAQWGMNPFAVAQKTHIVSGRLGYEAQLVNAVIQASGAIIGAPSYEFRGDGLALECRVGCVLRGEAQITWGEWLRNGDVQTKNSPLWKVNPKQQLGYLQLKNWARLYAPGAILGVYTPDELDAAANEATGARDMGMADVVNTGGVRRRSDALPAANVAPADQGMVDAATGEITQPAQAPAASKPAKAAPAAAGNDGGITGGQVAYLRNKLKAAGVDEQTILDRFQVASLELLGVVQFDALKAELLAAA